MMDGTQTARTAMTVDYEIYADGEALLGWLNATVQIGGAEEFDGNALLRALAAALQEELAAAGSEVAHLKMTLSPDATFQALAVINLVRNDFVPELSQELPDAISGGELIVNLRAESSPAVLQRALEQSLARVRAQFPQQLALHHLEAFEPGKPQPTHRDTVGRAEAN